MNHFAYQRGSLYAEDVSVLRIAKDLGTPLYVYSHATIERHFLAFDRAFSRIPHVTCYSCKANTNIALLRLMAGLGGGADIVSGGELAASLRASIPPEKIVYSGVGKTEEEIAFAVRSDIAMINIESAGELRLVASVGRRLGKKVPVSVRVNPEIDARTHPYITTGLRKNKFGVLWEEARALYAEIESEEHLVPVGISSHIGSQITEIPPFLAAIHSLKEMISELRTSGIGLKYIDIGGGLGITYKDESPPAPEAYARAIEGALEGTGLILILEPGRVIVGNSGLFVAKLLYVKETPEKVFYVVDGGMNDLVRPAFYGAYHEIRAVSAEHGPTRVVDVVGPICESGDFLAKDREIAALQPGELLAFMGSGAYGYAMSSNYNSRPRAAEVLVRGDEYFVIRQRETREDLMKGEHIPEFLKA